MAYRNYSTATSHIVEPNGQGDFTTIQAAVTAASAGDTIFVMDGSYTEDVTCKADVNITSYGDAGANGNVLITGKFTFTATGHVLLSNLRLTTNSDYILEVTGANDSNVTMIGCRLNMTDNTGINMTSTGTSQILCIDCRGDLSDATGTCFTVSGGGNIVLQNCFIENSGNSTTASTIDAGLCSIRQGRFRCAN